MKKCCFVFFLVIMLCCSVAGVSGASRQELNENLILVAQLDFNSVKELVAQGADVNAVNQNGETPLMAAASGGKTDIAAFLIARGAAVNHKSKSGFTPLICAALSGKEDLVRLLIAKGADVNAKDNEGCNAAYYASMYQYNDLAEMLMAAGKTAAGPKGDPSQTKTDLGEAALFAMGNKDYNRVRKLIEQGAPVNVRYSGGKNDSLLHAAVDQGSLEMASYLIGKGLNVDTRNQDGETPLYNALWNKQIEMIKLLLNKGAKVAVKNEQDRSPFYFFVTNCQENFAAADRQIAELLIKWGANVNQKNCFDTTYGGNQTALHRAAFSGNRGFVEFLLSTGATINAQDTDGLTPLHDAVSGGNPEVVRLLLAKGAKANIRDGSGLTPLDCAKQKKDPVIIGVLTKAGAK